MLQRGSQLSDGLSQYDSCGARAVVQRELLPARGNQLTQPPVDVIELACELAVIGSRCCDLSCHLITSCLHLGVGLLTSAVMPPIEAPDFVLAPSRLSLPATVEIVDRHDGLALAARAAGLQQGKCGARLCGRCGAGSELRLCCRPNLLLVLCILHACFAEEATVRRVERRLALRIIAAASEAEGKWRAEASRRLFVVGVIDVHRLSGWLTHTRTGAFNFRLRGTSWLGRCSVCLCRRKAPQALEKISLRGLDMIFGLAKCPVKPTAWCTVAANRAHLGRLA
mmetsp:Transcript_38150/g.100103  ORF Transcript_38150/g.100103 Transcript_38150/m.100103 type:complete len:282 (+) Transcript_38150:562-1407(+)